jgi:hypothetical protein
VFRAVEHFDQYGEQKDKQNKHNTLRSYLVDCVSAR